MQQTLGAQIIPGSGEITTTAQFLKQLETLHKADIKKLNNGDTTDMEGLAEMLGISSTTRADSDSSGDGDDFSYA